MLNEGARLLDVGLRLVTKRGHFLWPTLGDEVRLFDLGLRLGMKGGRLTWAYA